MSTNNRSIVLTVLSICTICFTLGCGVQESAGSPAQTDAGDQTATSLALGQTIEADKQASMQADADQWATVRARPPVTEDPTHVVERATSLARLAQWETEQAHPLTLETLGPLKPRSGTPAPTSHSPIATPLADNGILFKGAQPPFGSSTFVGINHWLYHFDDRDVSVYAGRQGPGPEHDRDMNQGMLVVTIWDSAGTRMLSADFYKTPISDGPARIIDAKVQGIDMYLTVVTVGGSRYLFHVNTGEFVGQP